ncbi:MAG: hypothetical protein K6B43_08600 [Treponema sp.]|nr:hypothetical protein [Treponema sp.]
MKLNKFTKIAAPAAAILASALLAGCGADVEDTTANYSEAEKNVTTTTSTDGSSYEVKGGSVVDVSGSVAVGGWDSVNLTVRSYAKLNLDTLESAVAFYSLKDNTDNAAYYPMHDKELAKKILWADESKNSSEMIETTIGYDLNLTDVTTNKIALIVDATKLKDKSGNAVLNLDEDDVAGEETDSFVYYITATGTGVTTALSNTYSEKFNKGCSAYFPGVGTSLYSSDGKLTGKLRFTANAPASSEPAATTATYDSSWASTLNSVILFQTKAADSTEWKDADFAFKYYDADDTTNTYAEIDAHTCVADTPVLPAGTQYRVVIKTTPNLAAPSWYEKVYGHKGYVFSESKEYKVDADDYTGTTYSGTSDIYTESPSYIVNAYSSSATAAVTWNPQRINSGYIETAQNDCLNVTVKAARGNSSWNSSISSYVYPYSAWEWEIEPATGVELSAGDDFVVTDSNNSKLDAIVTSVKDSSGKITKVYVELKNKSYAEYSTTYNSSTLSSVTQPILWVGHGTKLKENVAYPKQLEFGTYASSEVPSYISGYVELSADSSSVK